MSLPRLLIVDDDPNVLTVTSSLAKRFLEAVQIDTAASPHIALEMARKQEYTAVLTDILMPDQNGYELAAHVQRLHPRTRVVYMSGARPADGSHAGFGFLQKPFDLDALSSTLRSALNMGDSGNAEDPYTRRVSPY